MSLETGSKAKPFDQAWSRPWPQDELEMLGACPICSSAEREVLYDGLVDNVFYCAPGKWTMWRCTNCHSAYLDPRPSFRSIGLAYSAYYTHKERPPATKTDYSTLSAWRKIRRRLANGYINWRYGAHEEPALPIGALALMLAPQVRALLGRGYRHLPPLPVNGGSILDVGCGNGVFIELATSLGWNAVGIDPDPAAVANCLSRGLEVTHGGIEKFDGQESLFDSITLSHVIEHLHDPAAMLRHCHRLLKPDGQLWLETPNIDSLGHRRYRINWRGLEPPRHLVVFNPRSLSQALSAAGFRRVQTRKEPNYILLWMSEQSEAIARGVSVDADLKVSLARSLAITGHQVLQAMSPTVREFIMVTAAKGVA